VTAENKTLTVFRVRPYWVGTVRNAKQVPNRPAIWIEAGFDGRHVMTVQLALGLLDYLMNSCAGHCYYDYYILPQANPDGNNYQATNNTWNKNRQVVAQNPCKGVDLLNNFMGGNWILGSNDTCSPDFRGPMANSEPETQYQMRIKQLIPNIALSLTLTEVGAKISSSFAYKDGAPSTKDNEYMNAFVAAAQGGGYGSGSYSSLHAKKYGHPLDYNTQTYGNSFNVAIENGTAPGGNVYQYQNSQAAPIIVKFIQGLTGLLNHVKQDKSLPL